MTYWFVQVIVGVLSRLLFRLEVKGMENIPSAGPFMLASNHRSNLDPPILAVSIRRKLYFLTKAELFDKPMLGSILKKLNCIELKRSGEDKEALKKGLKILDAGRGLLIFPEGKRSRDNILAKGKAGLSLFAFKTGVPVTPVFITGTENVLPIGARFISPSKVRVVFGSPLYAEKGIERKRRKPEYQNFVDRIMGAIADLEKCKT
jgi:1-acyl-sn-glycerol-3-phosphate acyltransferase